MQGTLMQNRNPIAEKGGHNTITPMRDTTPPPPKIFGCGIIRWRAPSAQRQEAYIYIYKIKIRWGPPMPDQVKLKNQYGFIQGKKIEEQSGTKQLQPLFQQHLQQKHIVSYKPKYGIRKVDASSSSQNDKIHYQETYKKQL